MGFPRSARSTALAAGLLGITVAALAHVQGHWLYYARLNDRAPAAHLARPDDAKSASPARKLWIVVLDGLGWDRAQALLASPFGLEAMARPLIVDFPSLTFPAMVSIATGVPPDESGVRIDRKPPYAAWDSVSKRAAAAGIPVRISSNGFGEFAALLEPPAEFTSESVDEFLRTPGEGRELAWIHFEPIDQAGHDHGAASEEYADASRRGVEFVERLASRLDFRRDALVVLSDHGHRAVGGHGGLEPEVIGATFLARGGPFSKGRLSDFAPLRDVAPTLSAALGVSSPLDSIGHAMGDVFREPLESRAAVRGLESVLPPPLSALTAALVAALAASIVTFAWRHRAAIEIGPGAVYGAVFLVVYVALERSLGWSVRSEPRFYVDTIVAAGAGLLAAAFLVKRGHLAGASLGVTLVSGLAWLLAIGWAGVVPRFPLAPLPSFLILLLSTAAFYGAGVAGLIAIAAAWFPRKRKGAA